jgi:hypothetical protein
MVQEGFGVEIVCRRALCLEIGQSLLGLLPSGVVIGREISGQLCCGILIYLGVYM